MQYIGSIIAIQFILLAVYWLWKRYNPQGVLLISGILMLATASLAGLSRTAESQTLGAETLGIFRMVSDIFAQNTVHGGLMIIMVGGYSLYMRKIRASDALISVTIQPLALLHRHPYLAACLIIPIGQILFICIPSATGLGLLLATTVLPLLVRMGISRLTAASIITACTAFDLGPGSVNTILAAELIDMNKMHYFNDYQLWLSIPMTLVLMGVYFLTSRYYDRQARTPDGGAPTESGGASPSAPPAKEQPEPKAPSAFAILPVLPLLLLLFGSDSLALLNDSVELDITSAILISLIVSMLFDLIRTGSACAMFHNLKPFWTGMGKAFVGVVTLIICAEIFSKGLISLGLVDSLIDLTVHIGLPGTIIGIIMSLAVFLIAMLMGSGNASFFSFGPLVPGIATRIHIAPIGIMLPIQMLASAGRLVSPIAGVIIAVSDVAGVSPFDLVRRNLIPVSTMLILMLLYNTFFIL